MDAACSQGGNDSRNQTHATVPEQLLPACVRKVLDAARTARPECELACIAFRTLEDERVVARIGPGDGFADGSLRGASSTIRPKNVLVLTVSVTETTFETVRTITHVLVTVSRRRIPGRPGAT